ncbi:MAG: class I SAM-dependent methyltransferase [Holophagales bacterium]|nr:class I SAM-dependent methyltransferase [Holophagales bacterium]MYD23028.1 class I SAM-dependent methyltransferase [Holophagales bacterium]MYI34407.1 class I SAM-dependent methyltransferase [Holophagales bacterium]
MDWDFGLGREDLIHRIHSYPAKFPAFITTKALQYAKEEGVEVGVVADVFCGCGTAAVEAKRSGKRFWGSDINPVAVLIAQVKVHHYDDSVLGEYFEQIRNEFGRITPTEEDREKVSDRVRYWFHDRNIDDLTRLDQAIRLRTRTGSPHRRFFLCALSNILKPTSTWLTRSIKPQRDPLKSPRGVLETFESQFHLMRKANRSNCFPRPQPEVTIRRQNFLASGQPECRVDLLVTSPPYVTSYDYADIHQLSTLWLRYSSDYRSFRTNMLGNQYRVPDPDPRSIASLGPSAEATYRGLMDVEKRKARSVARYFLDLDKTAAKCWRMLNPGGMAVFLIGNTRYKNVTINNAGHLESCMRRAGFVGVERVPRRVSLKIMTPFRDAKGRFTRDASQRRVYGEEFVLIGRRP